MAKNKGDKHPDEPVDGVGDGAPDGEPDTTDTSEATEVDLDDELQRLLAGEEVTDASGSVTEPEHLADLKRITAEYANYRKRVERDRSVARELALAEMALSLLPVLDDFELAEAHGDLPEGTSVALVAQKLRATMERHGLERVSPAGEKFDPMQHEAIAHIASDVEADTIVDVAVVGYRLGDRLLRPAKVVVSAAKE